MLRFANAHVAVPTEDRYFAVNVFDPAVRPETQKVALAWKVSVVFRPGLTSACESDAAAPVALKLM